MTLPLWRQVCGDVRVIHIIRNGVDVAHSLIERERSTSKRPFLTLQYLVHLARPWRASEVKWVHFRDLGEAFALWSEYVQFGLDATALMNPAELFVTRYEDVLADPSRAVTRIAAFLGISIDTTLIEDLVSEVAIDRRFGFAAHPHLRRFYDRCSDHPLMAHFGYDRLHD